MLFLFFPLPSSTCTRPVSLFLLLYVPFALYSVDYDVERQAERRRRNPDGYTTSEMEELYDIYPAERRAQGYDYDGGTDADEDDGYVLSSPLARGFLDDAEE